MSRVVGWKIFVIVILSAVGAVAPLKEGVFAVWSLWGFRARLLLYLTLTGLGVAAYSWRRYKLAFAFGLASAALCAWPYAVGRVLERKDALGHVTSQTYGGDGRVKTATTSGRASASRGKSPARTAPTWS